MLNVMLDLETMGKGPDAAIVAIGAVKFDPATGLGDTFYANVDLASSVEHKGVMDASTVMWWMKQSDAARQRLVTPDPVCIADALLRFEDWVNGGPHIQRPATDVAMWGNGAAFDNVILRGAYERLGLEPPWQFRGDRCYRTLKALHPEVPLPPSEGTHHNALDDAVFQARHLLEILKVSRAA